MEEGEEEEKEKTSLHHVTGVCRKEKRWKKLNYIRGRMEEEEEKTYAASTRVCRKEEKGRKS